jgi:hypothetical protein
MKFSDITKAANLAKLCLDAVISVSDVRARRKEEQRKAEDERKDREIADLKKELAKLKAKKVATPIEGGK